MLVDIYQRIAEEEIIIDIEQFTYNNESGEYRYWGQELVTLRASMYSMDFDPEVVGNMRNSGIFTEHDAAFMVEYMETNESDMRLPLKDGEFAMDCLMKHITYQAVVRKNVA